MRITETKACEMCGATHSRYYSAKYCMNCVQIRNRESARRSARNNPNNIARRMVALAVSTGFMRPASEFLCIDCGDPAKHYDHRDYNRPLDVDPVCTRCHGRRGRGIELRFAERGPLAA